MGCINMLSKVSNNPFFGLKDSNTGFVGQNPIPKGNFRMSEIFIIHFKLQKFPSMLKNRNYLKYILAIFDTS